MSGWFSQNWRLARFGFFAVAIATLGPGLSFAQAPAQRPPPVRTAAIYGVIEIGGSGVKAMATRIVEGVEPDGSLAIELEILEDYPAQNLNAVFPGQIDAIAQAVARLGAEMAQNHKIAPLDLYIVGSSGVAALPHAGALRARVDAAVAGKAGALAFVTAQEEASYGFNGVVNCRRLAQRRSGSVFIDVGSSSTKAAYVGRAGSRCGEEELVVFDMLLGTKKLAAQARERGAAAPFREALGKARAEILDPAIEAELRKGRPGMETLPRVYLGGGVGWVMMISVAPQDRGRYIPITASQIAAFRAQLLADPTCVVDVEKAMEPNPECAHLDVDFSKISDPAWRASMEREHRAAVVEIYSTEQLQAGAEILAALADRLSFARRTLFYARPARRAWMLGYLLARERSRAESALYAPPR